MKTFLKLKIPFYLMSVISFIGCTAKVELDKISSPRTISPPIEQSGSSSLAVVKITNQKQLVESLINTLSIQTNRAAIMTLWDTLKPQLPSNGVGAELSTAALTATTQLVAQACFFVPITATGLPQAPSAGMAPSSAQIKSVADYFSNLFLNRAVTDNELSALMDLVPEVYKNSTLDDARKFKRLVDMICTVIGTSAEALKI